MRRLLAAAAVVGAVAVPTVALAPAQADPVTAGDLICVWDVPNEVGGVCVPGLDPVFAALLELIRGGRPPGSISL